MKIFIVFGTRPEAIKFVPLIYTFKDTFTVRVISSGQHSELLKQVTDFFKIKLDYSFGCMKETGDLEHLYECIHREMRKAIERENPDLIFVQGDTFTSYSASFVGFMFKKPVFHLEAGLRTFNRFSPFPEEMLRVLVGRLADFHFTPTKKAAKNLLSEGVNENRILIAGNTIVDALLLAQTLADENMILKELSNQNPTLKNLLETKKLVLITSHRRENIGTPLKKICRAIKYLAKNHEDTFFLWPMHKNPMVKGIVLEEMRDRPDNIILTDALSYQAMGYLMKKSYIILTDSGGIQEEAPTFGKPILILRDTTERPEVVDSGIGFLVGTEEEKIIEGFTQLKDDKRIYETFLNIRNPFGDGKAAERILKFLMLDEVRAFIENYPSSSEEIFNFKDEIETFEENQ
ncbi:MAG: UDP-N-acetylglucosamine 2-epimerase [Candidatus Schekmanbacteria bacterium RBG_16_38_10]|uniref:UDP-N-acetylglucosamine 2-epimerase (non-hydrolyzing) n=1 Tax=Candidatus Schekmanbacteria bacterium RBG_16_38_10 TaxID=1817879 RepID=A0A1F7RYX9_9BACT|nr:MAG: UDP-N-acetylglucosamine 2-epimerase [Candidatus Schekmanbacteria bacterium RBG_16_38_10]